MALQQKADAAVKRAKQQAHGPWLMRRCRVHESCVCWLQAMIRLAHGMELMLQPECSALTEMHVMKTFKMTACDTIPTMDPGIYP